MIRSYIERWSWVTGVFSLILGPTFAMMYLNRGWWAVIYFILPILLVASIFASAHYDLHAYGAKELMGSIFLLVTLVGLVHGIVIARRFDLTQSMHWYSRWYSFLGIFLLLLLCMLSIRIFLFQPFSVPSASMVPSLKIGDHFFIEKYSYGYNRFSFPFELPLISNKVVNSSLKRGDVVVFARTEPPHTRYVKRVVGLPGDRIQFQEGHLVINGVRVPKRFVGDYKGPESRGKVFVETLPNGKSYGVLDVTQTGYLDNTSVFKVPQSHYFVAGDNRDNSLDSRTRELGFVPEDHIIGRASLVFWNGDSRKFKYQFLTR